MKVAALATAFALLSPLVSAKTYPIKADGVRCRSGPSTNDKVVKSYNKGHQVTLTCQTTGTSIQGNNLWDKTSDGCYVTDYYVKTGTNGYVVKKCGGSTTPPSKSYCKGVNAAGQALIKEFEGFVAKPKPDPVNLPTVGYGHLCQKKNCAEVKYKFPLTKETATKLLNDDIPKYTACLGQKLGPKAKINDNQWAALTSLVFNIGCGGFTNTNLHKRLNNGENPNTVIAAEFPKYVRAGGKVFAGLVRRRKAEIALAKKPSKKQAFPKCT